MKTLVCNVPYITTIPEQSNLMLIIDKDNKNWVWFLNYFIQLTINKNTEYSLDLNFCYGDNYNLVRSIPILDKYILPRYVVDSQENLGVFVKNAIDMGYFVYFSVDEYEIEAYSSYHNEHQNHDLIVVGYNEDTFYIVDFFNSHYSVQNCLTEQLEAGYAGYDEKRDNSGFPEIYLLRNKEDYTYTFNIEMVKVLINEYIEGRNSNVHFHPIKNASFLNDKLCAFGINIYSVLQEYIDNLKDNKIKVRSFHILYEHKKMLLELIIYLSEKNFLKDDDDKIITIEQLVDDTLILRNLALKYNMTNNSKILQHMITKIDVIFQREKNLFMTLSRDIYSTPKILINENAINKSSSKSIVYKGIWEKTLNNTMYSGDEEASVSYLFKGSTVLIFIKSSKEDRKVNILCDNLLKEYILPSDESILNINNMGYGYHYIVIYNTDMCDIELLGIECRTEEKKDSKSYTLGVYCESDFTTKGNWVSDYGKCGYDIFGYKCEIPPYAKMVYSGFADKVWNMSDEKDNGQALMCEDGSKIVACKYFSDEASIDMVIAGNEPHTLSCYIMDCYGYERNVSITVINADSLEVLDIHTVNVINSGIYVKYIIKGHIVLEFRNIGKAIGVVSAIFID